MKGGNSNKRRAFYWHLGKKRRKGKGSGVEPKTFFFYMDYAVVLVVWAHPPRETASSMECKSCIPGGKKRENFVLSLVNCIVAPESRGAGENAVEMSPLW